MYGAWGHYTKWSKSENDKYCIIYLLCERKEKKNQKNKFRYTENKLTIARGEGLNVREISEEGQKVEEKKVNTVDIC